MTPKQVIDLIRSDPMGWLWDSQVEVEFFALISPLWNRASEAERDELLRLVLEGMPRERFPRDIEPAEWDRMNARAVWERLARIERDSGALPAQAAARLAAIRESFPQWRLRDETQDDFDTWAESRSGHPTDIDAAVLRAHAAANEHAELFELLTTGGHFLDGRLRQWEGVIVEAPSLALPFLRWMAATDQWGPEVLMWTLVGAAEVPDRISVEDWLEVFDRVPDHSWGSALHPASRAVEKLVIEADPADLASTLNLWDQAFRVALRNGRPVAGGDLLNAAINEPAGKLSEGLLDLTGRVLRKGGELLPSVVERLEEVLSTADDPTRREAGMAARMPVYARFSMLAAADVEWAVTHLVPSLDWARREEARMAWEGLMWSPRVKPDMWVHVEPQARNACQHYHEIGRGRSSLPGLLVSKYLDGLPPTTVELRRCLRLVDDAARIATVRYVSGLLAGADSKSGELWRTQVGRLFADVWPRELEHQSSDLTVHMAHAAIRAGDAFPEAVATLGRLMKKTNSPWMPLRWLNESKHPDVHPAAVVDLLTSVLEPGTPLRNTPLPAILGRVKTAGAGVPVPLDESAQRG